MGRLKNYRFIFQWGIILGVCILVRLPHFLTHHFYFDEDEALVGIMAQDLLSGDAFPYYFYGQNYGLSIFETVSVAGCIKLFGSGIWALRIGGLLVFSLGVTFIYRTMRERELSWLLTLSVVFLVLAFPTWYLWGAMVRGGYVTAFTACCIIFFITQRRSPKGYDAWILGLLMYISYEGHVLILLPVLPLILDWWLRQESKWKSALIIPATTLALLYGMRHLFVIDGKSEAPPLLWSGMQWENFTEHIDGWINGFSGFYFYAVNFDPPEYWRVGLYVLMLVMVATIVVGMWKATLKQKVIAVFVLLAIGVDLLLLAQIQDYAPRYFIGAFTGVLFLLLYLSVNVEFRIKQIFAPALAIVAFVGITTGSKMRRHWYDGKNFPDALEQVYAYMKEQKGVKAVIALDNQYAWNYMFGDDIPASNLCWENRTRQFSNQVKEVFENNPDGLMMTGFYGVSMGIEELDGFWEESVRVVPEFFVLRKVTRAHMEKGRETYYCMDEL